LEFLFQQSFSTPELLDMFYRQSHEICPPQCGIFDWSKGPGFLFPLNTSINLG
jgi:hypothetical protein